MSAIVLDASVVAAWYLRGQATMGADELLQDAPALEFVVPHIFPTEIANVLRTAERDGRISTSRSRDVLDDLGGYHIQVRPAPTLQEVGRILTLARDETLTAYDATYLDLAAREGLTLATRDGALIRAAVRRAVPARDLRT